MNQILSVNDMSKGKVKKSKMKNNKPIEIGNIIKFFSIAILIFGIFIIGSGSYSMYKEMTSADANPKPVIFLEQTSETQISLRITHDKELARVTYQWNMDEEIEIECSGKNQVTATIEIPEGTNAFIVYATDIKGQSIEYRKVYTVDNIINIDVEPDGNQLKINASGINQLMYLTYRWDEEEETKIDINDKNIETNIEIPMGSHKLTVIAVDENNKTKTFEKEIIGTTRPNIEITTDGSDNFIIKTSDEQGIKRIELIVNETEKYAINLEQVLPLEERKQFEYSYPITEGENKLEVTVYNENDVSETSRVKVNK